MIIGTNKGYKTKTVVQVEDRGAPQEVTGHLRSKRRKLKNPDLTHLEDQSPHLEIVTRILDFNSESKLNVILSNIKKEMKAEGQSSDYNTGTSGPRLLTHCK